MKAPVLRSVTETPGFRFPGQTAADWSVLGIVLGGLALLIAPSHWTSIWMDREFSGWVAPIANRIGAGQMLYVDGARSPMPPLPALLLAAITGGQATWIDESRLIVAFQTGILALGYATIRRLASWPVPLLTVLAASPLVFALPKTIAYDAMAQFWVAFAGWLLIFRAQARQPTARAWTEVALGAVTALLLFTKQSTAVGAGLGCFVALWFLSAGRGGRCLFATLARYTGASALVFALLLLALGPWMDRAHFVTDVFMSGAEVKGGRIMLLRSLMAYGWEFAAQCARLIGVVLVVAAWRAHRSARMQPEIWPAAMAVPAQSGWPLPAAAIACVGIPVLASAYLPAGLATRGLGLAQALLQTVLWTSFVIAVVVAARELFARGNDAKKYALAFTALTVLFTASAVFHSLSDNYFRWSYDNNPLIVLMLGFIMAHAVKARASAIGRSRSYWAWGIVAVQASCWAGFVEQYRACKSCVEEWPECAHLRGARMPASAGGMRELVAKVRSAAPAPRDTVLLLPNDPNVEAWFERPRPNLTAAIVFSDQYLDRFVDEDFERLRRTPPKVIVIGPRGFWRGFQRRWHIDYGCERLVDRVTTELLPTAYDLAATQPIQHMGRTDYMDIFLLRPAARR